MTAKFNGGTTIQWFPMQDGPDIPYNLAEDIYKIYETCFGSSQSLARIAERGGFYYSELPHLLRTYHARVDDEV